MKALLVQVWLLIVLCFGMQMSSINSIGKSIKGSGKSALRIPVVYIHFGSSIPTYLKINLELASAKNPVILLHSDPSLSANNDFDPNIVTVDLISSYFKSADAFSKMYRHMSKDFSRNRKLHELQCIQRWFVLMEYMKINNCETIFYADGDSSVFADITAVHSLRQLTDANNGVWRQDIGCDAVINIEFQGSIFHWVAAGEASVWTYPAIKSFCNFASAMYQQKTYINVLEKKRIEHGSNVVDMSILWLWFVANHKKIASSGFNAGRPFYPTCRQFATPGGEIRNHSTNSILQMRLSHEKAFGFASNLTLPKLDPVVSVCNGMDVINRTAYDHMHGWKHGKLGSFSFNLDTKHGSLAGVPSFTEVALYGGGKPESLEQKEIEKLKDAKIYLNNIHYQGGQKSVLEYDVCRVLSFLETFKNRRPTSRKVMEICSSVISSNRKMDSVSPCLIRPACGSEICV